MSGESSCERDLVGDTSKHDRSTTLWLTSALRATISSHVGQIAATVVVMVAAATWTAVLLWALPAIYLLLLAAKLLDGRARQSALRRARAMPIRLPEPTSFSDGGVRSVIQRLGEARRAIEQALDAGPHGAGFDLTSAIAQVPQLERDVVVLARRAEYGATFLGNNPVGALLADDCRQEEQIQREGDPVRADLLRRAGAHLKRRLASVTELRQEYESLLATARNTVGALEALPARMTLLQLRRLQACHAPATGDGEDVGGIDACLGEIERALTADAPARQLDEPRLPRQPDA